MGALTYLMMVLLGAGIPVGLVWLIIFLTASKEETCLSSAEWKKESTRAVFFEGMTLKDGVWKRLKMRIWSFPLKLDANKRQKQLSWALILLQIWLVCANGLGLLVNYGVLDRESYPRIDSTYMAEGLFTQRTDWAAKKGYLVLELSDGHKEGFWGINELSKDELVYAKLEGRKAKIWASSDQRILKLEIEQMNSSAWSYERLMERNTNKLLKGLGLSLLGVSLLAYWILCVRRFKPIEDEIRKKLLAANKKGEVLR